MRLFRTVSAVFFGITLSIWLGRADLQTDDTGILVGLIGCGGALIALVEPRRPWIWGLVVPAGVIGVELWRGFGLQVLAIAAVTIAVASAGAYLGALVRRRSTAR